MSLFVFRSPVASSSYSNEIIHRTNFLVVRSPPPLEIDTVLHSTLR